MQEAINRIKEAEAAAQAVRDEADERALRMAAEVKLEGRKLAEQIAADAAAEADEIVARAKAEGAREVERRIAAAREEAAAITAAAELKIDDAALRIVEGIVNEI